MFTKTQIFPHEWVRLPATVRFRLADEFGIKKSEGVNVVNGEVVSDGYTAKDLAVMDIEALQRFTGEKNEDFVLLLNETIKKLENKYSNNHVIEHKPAETPVEEVETPLEVEEVKKDAKRKKTK